jgi:hypothetical protein
MYNTPRRNSIQYAYITYPTTIETLYAFPTADIKFPIEPGRRTASYKPDSEVFYRPIEYIIFN